jgi:hypothetical protein
MVDRSSSGWLPDGITREEFLKMAGAAGLLVTASGTVMAVTDTTATAQSAGGSFSAPFVEPVIYLPGGRKVRTRHKCIRDPQSENGQEIQCKPTAGSIAVLPDGRFLYWNALEGTENSQAFILDNQDEEVWSDQSRLLTLGSNDEPSWVKPKRNRGGTIPTGISPLLKPLVISDRPGNNGTMFCAHQVHLPDGNVLVAGGTAYFQEPTIELEGVKAVRIFDRSTNRWYPTDFMRFGRWYPACVPLANGDVFVCGGVTKLEKPVYPDDPLGSGDNVRPTETYSLKTGKWTPNGPGGRRSLPLMPRIHLLPNGHVVFNGAGQGWSPNGQSYRQVTWNIVATYDPEAKLWTERGFAGFPFTLDETSLGQIARELGTTPIGTPVQPTVINNETELFEALGKLLVSAPPDPIGASNAAGVGSRLSTFEVPLLMEPDEAGEYHKYELLTAGGDISGVVATSPGSYVATNLSRVDTLTTRADIIQYRSRFTGSLNNRRWYSSGVLLPTGEVLALSGADRDEVVFPGIEVHVKVAELFDPETETWTEVAEAHRARTYHNSAILMPDGRVLAGGHAPIPTGYISHMNLGEPFGPNDGRDPSFEIYSPPYASQTRPVITNRSDNPRRVDYGETFTIETPEAADIGSVVLMRVSSVTHINDTEQRGVKLPFLRGRNTLTAQMPRQRAVASPGHYWVFIVTKERVPSVAMPVRIPMS